ncbi:hypothetical protein [Actinoplanes sp. NPDC051494]|uniref:hypothetical protein n=1 Tax=Actinoplanes sp. NPDC051494 TaxID=3363907 RepID=UPI00378AD2D5
MTLDLPYALGCPSCTFYVEVSEEDADSSLSFLADHLFSKHAGYDRTKVGPPLAKAVELTEDEAAAR